MNRTTILKKITYIFVLASSFLHGCNQDDHITPSNELPFTYQLPQGIGECDDRIVDFLDKTETFVIYDYGEYDPIWNVQSLIATSYRIVRPQKEYIEEGINLLFDLWLDLYPTSF